MPKSNINKTVKKRRVRFALKAATAKEVLLIGDFNQWNPDSHPMKNKGQGEWEKTAMLAPGRYEYKFLMDGNWKEDSENDQVCPNCFGTYNNVLVVK